MTNVRKGCSPIRNRNVIEYYDDRITHKCERLVSFVWKICYSIICLIYLRPDMTNVEEALNNAEDVRKKQQLDKDIFSLESKKSRMTDMLIDGSISREVYDEKVIEL